MKNAAAIQAQLVDMRNVGAHKSLKLTLHAPEELAMQAIEAFGWPTRAAPVPVALARLADGAAHAPREADSNAAEARQREPASRQKCIAEAYGGERCTDRCIEPRDCTTIPTAARHPTTLVQQAGICCNDPRFWKFLARQFGENVENALAAAHIVRQYCNIISRTELKPDTNAGRTWRDLHSQFLVWRDNPDLPEVGRQRVAS